MIKKTHYIRVKTLPEIKTEKVEKKNTKAEKQDKIARLYALAEKLGVKIGGLKMVQTFSLSATELLLIFSGLDRLIKDKEGVAEIDRQKAGLLRTRLMLDVIEREKGNYGMVDEKIFLQMKAEYDKGGKFKDFVDKASQLYEDTPDDEMHKLIIYEYFKSIQKGGCNER